MPPTCLWIEAVQHVDGDYLFSKRTLLYFFLFQVKFISDLRLHDYKKVPETEAMQNNGVNLTVTASA